MWIFTRYGFYSTACAEKPDGLLDPDTVMVRARSITHLRNLQKRFAALADHEILNWPNRDYRYRIIVPKAAWVGVVTELAQEQAWSNFKNEVAEYQGEAGVDYVNALHDVWHIMGKLQTSDQRQHRQRVLGAKYIDAQRG